MSKPSKRQLEVLRRMMGEGSDFRGRWQLCHAEGWGRWTLIGPPGCADDVSDRTAEALLRESWIKRESDSLYGLTAKGREVASEG
jgi:hypothetical protein